MIIYLETFGCQMNRLDSDLIAQLLRSTGHSMTDIAQDADVVLYNTCSVRQHAEQKVYSRLGRDALRKKEDSFLVGVLGCMAQREGEDIRRRYKAVDIVCAPGQLYQLAELIEQHRAVALDPKRTDAPDLTSQREMDRIDRHRDTASGVTPSAFVRIMRGCNQFCSYCIVPFTRGAEYSRPPGEIAEEVRRLVESGTREITLLGQAVNRYHHERGETTERFSDLLARLSDTPDLRRLRFVTSHPVEFTPDVIDAMRDLPNVCEYIHVPAQSGSDAMLRAMNRGYTRSQYDDLIAMARERIPHVSIASDFIVGFCGESDADHQASLDLIGASEFKNSFIFKYSPRPGTYSAKNLTDDVPEKIKRARNAELLAAQNDAGKAHHAQFVGQTMEVLVTGPSPMARKRAATGDGRIELTGRTRGDHIVIFNGDKSLTHQFVYVTIHQSDSLTLFGELHV